MTSISALSSHQHHASPLQRLQDELQAEVSSGAINASDQSALASALGDIDSALQSGSASDLSSGSKSSPEAFKSKIDDLIQKEVSAGKLSDEQATELQDIFKAAFSQGPGGAGGPPPGGPPPVSGTDSSSSGNSVADLLQQFLDSLKSLLTDSTSTSTTQSSDTTNADDSSSTSATKTSSNASSATDLLEQFLQSLKDSLVDSTYDAARSSGQAKAGDPSISGVLINDRI